MNDPSQPCLEAARRGDAELSVEFAPGTTTTVKFRREGTGWVLAEGL